MIERRTYDLAGLAEENLRLKYLLERMAAAFKRWDIQGKEGLLAEVREALK